MDRNQKLMTTKTIDGVRLHVEKYQRNPFEFWKKNLHQNNKMLLASIPFIRNIAEYTGDETNFLSLTNLLHFKKATTAITMLDLENIFKAVLRDKNDLKLPEPDRKVVELIFSETDKIVASTSEVVELENKIVLAIAIRLKAEEFMILKINNPDFVNSIRKNQTISLFIKYKEIFSQDYQTISTLDQVNLMTPENIHLNSFMYEPILDMSHEHLIALYKDILDLLKD
jgi:hypothetical protein